MTVPLVAAAFFGGNIKNPLVFKQIWLHQQDDQQEPPQPLAARRRGVVLWQELFVLLAEAFKNERGDTERPYEVDSLSVAVCKNSSVFVAADFSL